jgi:hypothetical protein
MQTAERYRARFIQLQMRYLREHGDWDWAAFVDGLIARRPTLRASSYRQYRAAVVWALQVERPEQAEALRARLRDVGSAGRRGDLPCRTSAGKAKSLRIEEVHRLVLWLQDHGGIWDDLAARWLFWSIQTGLRPIEWRDAMLQPNALGYSLQIRNAKHSQGRAHGEHRTVHLQIKASEAFALQAFLDRVQGDFEAAYQGCRLALHRATQTLWPRRMRQPSLYSGRHQFAADAKASGLAPEAIAALMGHAVTDTHQTHYGKRRCGRAGLIVAADPEDVQRVRARMQARSDIQALRAGAPSIGPGE